MSETSSPSALLPVLVSKHHKQQEFTLLIVKLTPCRRYISRNTIIKWLKKREKFTYARYRCSPAWPGPEELGPEVFVESTHLPRKNLPVTETETESTTTFTSLAAGTRFLCPPSESEDATYQGYDGHIITSFPSHPRICSPSRPRGQTRKNTSPYVCSPESSARPPPPQQQLMDFGRTAAKTWTFEAKNGVFPRPSGLPFPAAPSAPWFRELWVNASK